MFKKDFSLFDKDGYISYKQIVETYNPTLTVIIGGRGTGKTYNVLDYLTSEDLKFILLRRTNSERELIRGEEKNPLCTLFEDGKIKDFEIKTGKYIDDYVWSDDKKVFAYAMSVATSAKVRGFNGQSIKVIYYDEFIKDNNEKSLADEAGGYFQIIETVNRNRELKGKAPVKLILTANSNNIFNPICDALKLTDIILDMRKNGVEYKYIKKKSLFIADVRKSPISERKKETYLYQITKGTSFYKMAIENEFYNDISDYIGVPYPLREFKPMCGIKDVNILRHSSRPIIYVTRKSRGACRKSYNNINDFLKEKNIMLQKTFRYGLIFFENMELAGLFKDFI